MQLHRALRRQHQQLLHHERLTPLSFHGPSLRREGARLPYQVDPRITLSESHSEGRFRLPGAGDVVLVGLELDGSLGAILADDGPYPGRRAAGFH